MSSPRDSLGSPRVHRLSALSKGASSCPSSPGQAAAKPDRTADFAAVRNLAQSYGVDLLPLEMGFTPVRTDKPAQRLSTADSAADLPGTPEVGENAAGATPRGLAQAYSDASTASAGGPHEQGAARAQSPRPRPASAPKPTVASPVAALDAAGPALGCFPIDVDGSEANTDSPSGEADLLDAQGEASTLYLDEECLPVEERVALLEEERDMLVDKLLATTEALHASEARNRQSEASQGQVHALLEQLQELLRRAEVERDRAKLQLKRHRASNSQFMFPGLPLLAASAAAPEAFAVASASGQGADGALTARPRSKKYKASLGGAAPSAAEASGASPAAASRDLFEVAGAAAQRALLPRRRSSAAPAAEGSADASGAAAGSVSAGGASSAASAAQGPAPGAAASTQAQQKPSDSSVAGVGACGSRQGSRDSSCDSSDAVSPAGPADITLTPSTDDARPPVQSVVRGFEALLNRRRGAGGSTGGPGSAGGRSRDLQLSARSSGSGSCSPMASRGNAELPFAAVTAQAPATGEDAAEAGAPAESPASPTAEPAGAEGAEGAAEQGGLSAQSSEVFRRRYVDAAVAGAEAERSRRSSVGAAGKPGAAARTAAAAGSAASSSVATTPTAAALYNAAPVGSYMLGSSCFSEEEEAVSAGGAVHSARPASGPQEVYDPSRFTPVRPAGVSLELLPGAKRGRSSPAATPTAQQRQGVSRSSPGSAFGSVISYEADSPAGSVTQSPAGAGVSAGGSGHSSTGGSRGKVRPASRLGVASPATAGPQEPTASLTAASKQQQGHKGRKAKGQQQESGSGASKSSSAGAAKSSSSAGGTKSSSSVGGAKSSSGASQQPSVQQSEVDLAPPAAASGKSSRAAPTAAARSKTGAKKAVPAVRQQAPAVRTGPSSPAAAGARAQGVHRLLPLLLLAAALILSAAAAVFVWLRSQSKLAAMQAQVRQLQRQLSEASTECPSSLGAPSEL